MLNYRDDDVSTIVFNWVNEEEVENFKNSIKEAYDRADGFDCSVRAIFDKEHPDCSYASDSIFNFLCACEEVLCALYEGRFEDAENLIGIYGEDF